MSVIAIAVLAGVAVAGATAGTFADDDGNVHEPNIEAIAAAGITQGCDPIAKLYCPDAHVSRAEMAAFLIRAVGQEAQLPTFQGYFPDVAQGEWFTPYVERLYELSITQGGVDGLYRPGDSVSRGEMSAFLLRAIGEDANVQPEVGRFSDIPSGIWFASFAERLFDLGITTGCATDPLRYCPTEFVKRDQMASFIARALNLEPITPSTTTTLAPPTTAYEIKFGNGVWRVGADIPYGTYRNSDSSRTCYGARLSGFGGSFDEIITNEISSSPMIVTLASSDAGFESERCGTWSNNLSPRTSPPTASHGDGYWMVGSEVAAGLWRNSDSSGTCYWERLSGFDWSFNSIITNGISDSIQTVQVAPSDVGFHSERCGTWNYLGS